MSIIEQFLGIIAPHHCLGCGGEGAVLCAGCAGRLPAIPPRCYRCNVSAHGYRTCAACSPASPLFAVMAATPYADLAKEVIHRLKFERAQAVAADVAAVLASGIVLDDITCITYVPTAPGRIRSRGYDQAALMAKAISRRTGLPCYALLARKGSQRQVGQGRIARHQQMQDAFYARNAGMARGKHILLIDDVLTTGATCEAAARVLLQSGARRVSAAVFAAA